MDGLFFIIIFIFFVLPIFRSITKNAKKNTSKYKDFTKKASTWGLDHGQVRQKRHRELHRNDSSDVFPEEHAARVRQRDKRDRAEYRRMETNIHSKKNRAMTQVSNKSRSDWGTKGESGMTSSKGITIFILLLLLAHFILVAIAPDLLPSS